MKQGITIKCGSAYCRGGHIQLTAYSLNSMNCGAHDDYTQEDIDLLNRNALHREKLWDRWYQEHPEETQWKGKLRKP